MSPPLLTAAQRVAIGANSTAVDPSRLDWSREGGIHMEKRFSGPLARLGLAATFLFAGATALSAQAAKEAATGDQAIRPFRVHFPDEALADLRRRIAATRWPDKETVTDQSQGVQLATMQKLARYWATDYDWRKCEAKLNALPQFVTDHRWGRHPFHPCPVEACERAAAHRHARMAGLDHRAAEDHRSADQSDGPWRERGGRLRRRDSVAAGLRLFRQADRDSAGIRSASRAPGSC